MKILNVSPLELIFLVVIVIIFLGPEQIVTVANRLGKLIRTVTRSEFWINVTRTANDLRQLPKEIAKESGLQESLDEINQSTNGLRGDLGEFQKDIKLVKQEAKNSSISDSDAKPTDDPPDEIPTLMKK